MPASSLPKVSPSTRTTAVSLSPNKSRRQVAAFIAPRPTKKENQNELSSPKCGLAMSRAETVFVSAAGDVLVCRSRESPYAAALDDPTSKNGSNEKKESSTTTWWNSSESSLCGLCLPCDDEHSEHDNGGGLLGGAAQVAHDIEKAESESKIDDDDITYPKALALPLQDMHSELPSDADEESLLPLPSFDYSGFLEGESDMETNNTEAQRTTLSSRLPTVEENGSKLESEMLNDIVKDPRQKEMSHPQVMHGVPTFLPAFAQIRITKVSAHPLGSHVLLISSEALLFSYGLNDHGQLGLGRKTSKTDKSQGFVTKPTIVTPFLENGGKAVVCSAGVNHSLVVVKTEGRRVGRLRRQSRTLSGNIAASSPSSSIDANSDSGVGLPDDSTNSIWHHQLYGFGGNDCQKLGLVNTEESTKAEVLLPRRVALHCKVWPEYIDNTNISKTEFGIFAVAAALNHSAALVRRASGAVELYTWGNAGDGALGHSKSKVASSGKRSNTSVVPVPTIVPSVSIESSDKDACPVSLAVGPTSTFVLTSKGQCLSFGTSEDGLLGQGSRVTRSDEPKIISFPLSGGRGRTRIKSISIGARHAVAVASDGSTYCWGTASEGRIGLPSNGTGGISNKARGGSRDSVEQPFLWKPVAIDVSSPKRLRDLRKVTRKRVLSDSQLNDTSTTRYGEDVPPRAEETRQDRVMTACAGYDSTVFVMESGTALSCGKGSARLGQGERYTDSLQPSRVFGGLHLWK